jgi:hypothetical protein
MSNTNGTKTDKELFEFEVWYKGIINKVDIGSERNFLWLAWLASREVYLEEAAKVCDELSNYTCHNSLGSQGPTPSECAFFIRELK